MKLRTIAISTVVVILAAACSPTTPTTVVSTVAAEPGPVVTVTATASPEPAAAGPDYGFTFFEQAQLGSTFAQASEALGMPVSGAGECPHYGAIWLTDRATTYAFTDAMNPGAEIQFFYTQQYLGLPSDSWPRNAEGVGIGSTEAEILAAYPDASMSVVEDLGAGMITVLTVQDPDSDSHYSFGLSDGSTTVDLLQWGPQAGSQWSHLCLGF